MKTIFQKIIDGQIPCDKVFENERILAFNDIAPKAPVHIILIPKKKFLPNISALTADDGPLLTEIFLVANELAKKFHIEEGYRLITNNGEGAGQTVFYLHFHLLGGRTLSHLG